jgi:type I site-specific restriction endonuclease
MAELDLSSLDLRIKTEGNIRMIFDRIRKKYLVLTPEEWVRQHYIEYLLVEKKVPAGLVGIENGLKVNRLAKRADIIVYDKAGAPLLLVECKAGTVKIDSRVFEQIGRYNHSLRVKYLVVTNGMVHYCCRIDHENKSYEFLQEVPVYDELI